MQETPMWYEGYQKTPAWCCIQTASTSLRPKIPAQTPFPKHVDWRVASPQGWLMPSGSSKLRHISSVYHLLSSKVSGQSSCFLLALALGHRLYFVTINRRNTNLGEDSGEHLDLLGLGRRVVLPVEQKRRLSDEEC